MKLCILITRFLVNSKSVQLHNVHEGPNDNEKVLTYLSFIFFYLVDKEECFDNS